MENDDSEPATASCLKTDFPSGGKEGGIPHDVVREVIDVFVVRCHFLLRKILGFNQNPPSPRHTRTRTVQK